MSQFLCFLNESSTPALALAGIRTSDSSISGKLFKIISPITTDELLFEGVLKVELGSSVWVRKDDGFRVLAPDVQAEKHEEFRFGIVWDDLELARI